MNDFTGHDWPIQRPRLREPRLAASNRRSPQKPTSTPMDRASGTAGCKAGLGSEAPLGNQRIGFPPPRRLAEFDRRERRRERMQLQRGIRDITSLERLKTCGHTAVSTSGVVVRGGAQGVGFAGLATCGSVWACPVCASKIAAHRGAELGTVLQLAQDQGKTVAMVTLTVRHKKGDGLKSVWDAVAHGWNRITSGKPWGKMQAQHGVVGWARAVEVTHGSNGWHVHVHAVLVLDHPGEVNAIRLGDKMFARWSAGLEAKGFSAVAASGGLDVSVSKSAADQLGRYLAKMGGQSVDQLALEATHGAFKRARAANRSPFQIAKDFLMTGDVSDLAIWREWETASKGRRALTWSKTLRVWALAEEKTDEEIVAEDLQGDDLVLLPPETWAVVRHRSWEVLDHAEQGLEALTNWLDSCGLRWFDPPKRI